MHDYAGSIGEGRGRSASFRRFALLIMSIILTTEQLGADSTRTNVRVSQAGERACERLSARPTPRGGAGGAHAYMYRYLGTVSDQFRIR